MEIARVVELYLPGPAGAGGQIGSGYRLTGELVLTAAHVVAGLPVAGQDTPLDALNAADRCDARPVGESEWTPAALVWRGHAETADVAVLRLAASAPPLPAGSPGVRWGRVEGNEPVAVTAIGFPWAQERPDRVRDTEHLLGVLAPAGNVKAGRFAVTVLTAAPTRRADGSPWGGMSGAALFAGPFLIGVLVVDPTGFGTDRLDAAPLAPLLRDPTLRTLLDTPPTPTPIGPAIRLSVSADTSVAVVAPYQPVTSWLGRAEARLILPEYGIVPFLGREEELLRLEEWCLGEGPPLRLLLGNAGAGKTRLASEACVRMAGHGWQAGFADPDARGGQAELAFDRPTLLVVDNADHYVPLLEDLVSTLNYCPPDAPPARLLLLARHRVSWWDTLNQRTDHLAAELAADPLLLQEGGLPVPERAAHHTAALSAFIYRLADSSTNTAARAADPAAHAPPDLTDPAFANPLLVHMHALLHAAGANVATTGAAVRDRILDAILNRERRRWAETFPAGVSTGGDTTRHQAVTTATLIAPRSAASTAELMTIIGDFGDASAGVLAAVAAWLHEIYPGTEPAWVAPLRPDLLAEQLLATCPQLTDLVLNGYERLTCEEGVASQDQVEQLLTELTRAAARPVVREALDGLLGARLQDLITAAITQPAGRLPDLVDLAVTYCPQPQAAAALVDRLPDKSIGLATLAATLHQQATAHYRQVAATQPGTANFHLAMSLNNLSNALADLNRREDALAASAEAVTRARKLVADFPPPNLFRSMIDSFRRVHHRNYEPTLAAALATLASRLSELGSAEDAVSPLLESIALFKRLAKAYPWAFTDDLAKVLANLSNLLANLGRSEDALPPMETAVALWQRLATADPDAYLPDLLSGLSVLSTRLDLLGRSDEAMPVIEHVVRMYRQLAADHPDKYTDDLASSLATLSNVLASMGRPEEALGAMREAISRQRRMASSHPGAHIPDLAMSLAVSSHRLAALKQSDDALNAIEEAITLNRELAATSPEAHLSDLAHSLLLLSLRLVELGRPEEALSPLLEAVALWREVATAHPDAHTADLIVSLSLLSDRLGSLGRNEEGLAASKEAVAIYRTLASSREETYPLDTYSLAAPLTSLSGRLIALNRPQDALPPIKEAVTLLRPLASSPQDAYAAALAGALLTYGLALTGLRRHQDALPIDEEAVDRFRDLASAHPETFTPGLALSLSNLAQHLAALGRPREALTVGEEAVGVLRQLATGNPDDAAFALAWGLIIQAGALLALGRPEEALTVGEEAVAHYRQLAAHDRTHTSGLAQALTSTAGALLALGRPEEALTVGEEAVAHYRQLAAHDHTHTSGLAQALTTVASALATVGQLEDSLAVSEEAVDLYGQQATAGPVALNLGLAATLITRAGALRALGHARDALAASEEASAFYRQLLATQPHNATLSLGLAQAVTFSAGALADLCQFEQSLHASEEAIGWYRQLGAAGLATWTPDLAMALNTRAGALMELGRATDSLAAIEEAVALCRQMAAAKPNAFVSVLGGLLMNYGFGLGELHRPRDALAAFLEAASLTQRLPKTEPVDYRDALVTALRSLAIELRSLHHDDEAQHAELVARSLDD